MRVLHQSYSSLFTYTDEVDEDDSDNKEQKERNAQSNQGNIIETWFSVVDLISETVRESWEYVWNMDIVEAFNIWIYRRNKDAKIKKIMDQQRAK